jgi:parallel beta-helix repeat protein
MVQRAFDVTIEGNDIEDNGHGVLIGNYRSGGTVGSTRIVIGYNRIAYNTADGILLNQTSYARVPRNYIGYNGYAGINLTAAEYNTITNNVILDNSYGSKGKFDGLHLPSIPQKNTISNNVVYSSSYGGYQKWKLFHFPKKMWAKVRANA